MMKKNDQDLLLFSKQKSDTFCTENEDVVSLTIQEPSFQDKKHFSVKENLNDRDNKYRARPSFWKWLTFMDVYPETKRINKGVGVFEIEDVPKPEHAFNFEKRLVRLEHHWNNELQKEKPSFSKALIKTFPQEIAESFGLSILENFSKIFCAIYMGKIIRIFTSNTDKNNEIDSGELLSSAIILSILTCITLFAKCRYFYTMGTNVVTLKTTLAAIMYKKLNSTSLSSLHEINLGKIMNLIGNDLSELFSLWWFPSTVLLPLFMVLGTYLMWGYFGPSCLFALISLMLVTICQIYLSKATEESYSQNKKIADQRVKLTHEVLEGIRLIKMYTWDKIFERKIFDLRQKEHQTFMKINKVDIIGINLSNLSVYFSTLVLCSVYILFNGILSSEKVYATMMILVCLSSALLTSHTGRMGFINVKLVLSRIEELLKVKDVDMVCGNNQEPDTPSLKTYSEEASVTFKNYTAYWNPSSSKPCLADINLTFKRGTVTTVIGKIGAGKSTLLLSFLNEIPLTNGVLKFSGKIAYVEQDPIIFSGTIRENILFGNEWDPALYQQVINNCNLVRDLELFSYGDLTRIGERGINLSGGQKARLSLARALYSQSDIYLLDDPFSALDSRVSRDIFDKVLKGDLTKDKTVILVTHHLHFAKESDFVVLMNEGRVEAQGTYSQLEKLNISLLNTVFKTEGEEEDEEENKEEIKQIGKNSIAVIKEDEIKEELTQTSWQTYKNYLEASGTLTRFALLVGLFVISHILIVYLIRFMGKWAEDHTQFYEDFNGAMSFDNTPYIAKSVILLISIFVLNHLKTLFLFNLVLSINTELHNRMIRACLRSKVAFFDVNPIGRILNRFSSDLGILDKNNLREIFSLLDNIINYLASLGTVCLINSTILLPIIVVLFGLLKIKTFFKKPVVLAKKLDLISKSPLLSAVPATVHGLIIIRAYNQGGRFIKGFTDILYNNLKTHLFVEKTIRLFSLILDALLMIFTISGIWIFIILILYYDFETGLLGLCFMSLLKIGDQGSILIRQSLWVELNMQSAQRLIDYSNLKEENPEHIPKKDNRVDTEFKGQWPVKGEINFNQVFLRYREELGFALKGLTVNIQGGSKVACVGRTGAGKSSIIQALFRLVEIEQGKNFPESSITLDGVDISSIGLKLLRSRLSIIPQTPVVFADTIKKNLDPFGELEDYELWTVLSEVGLDRYVRSLPDQLDTDMTVSAAVFSTGQKQLVCLARAIINKSKVIILDEATANVDVETDSFIQQTIMEKFRDCTVLTVAHRLITIANYDKVVVVDDGKVAEYDSPYELLVENIGDSQITKKEGVFAEMVKSTGVSMSRKIFKIAEGQFYKNQNKTQN